MGERRGGTNGTAPAAGEDAAAASEASHAPRTGASAATGRRERPLAVVTGASSGIGLELARRAVADDHDVVLVARRRDRLEALARELGPGRAEIVVADLGDRDGPAALEAALAGLGRPVDVLVNNAGYGAMEPVAGTDPDELLGMIDLNVRALVDLSRRFLPGMVERRSGGVLNVASTAAFQPGPGMAVYFATKSFVLSFSEALHQEVRGRGVRVTALCPGPTITEFAERGAISRSPLFRMSPKMTADAVARIGWDGFSRGRRVVVAGTLNRLGAATAPLVPRRLLLPAVRRINRPS